MMKVMRYADGPSCEEHVTVAAPPERVWALVCDINVAARFSTEFAGAEWLDPGPAVGARFVGRNEHPALGGWETTSVITAYDPPHEFAWAVTDAEHPSSTWWYVFDDVGDGTVVVHHGGRMGPAPSGLSIAIEAMPDKEERIVARRLDEWRANIGATLAGIKALAEVSA